MALNHPLAQLISFSCACCYAVQAEGKQAVLFALRWCLLIMLQTAFLNPAFSHDGVPILLYFPTGNPLTLESILYGLPGRTAFSIYRFDDRDEDVTLECDDLWFRYEKDSPDVVKGFSLKLHKAEFYAILGGNGAGKSTPLKVISGLRSAYRGDVRFHGELGHLPQNP